MENPIVQSITDLSEFIKKLFEIGTGHSVEECRKDLTLARPRITPYPIADMGPEDYRSMNDKFCEQVCRSYLTMALSLSQSKKGEIPFYDLICLSQPYTKDFETLKHLYNEALRFTTDNNIRDHVSELLYKLNEERRLRQCDISERLRDIINEFDKLKNAIYRINRFEGSALIYLNFKEVPPKEDCNSFVKTNYQVELSLSGSNVVDYSEDGKNVICEGLNLVLQFSEVSKIEFINSFNTRIGSVSIYSRNHIDAYNKRIIFECSRYFGDTMVKLEAEEVKIISIEKFRE